MEYSNRNSSQVSFTSLLKHGQRTLFSNGSQIHKVYSVFSRRFRNRRIQVIWFESDEIDGRIVIYDRNGWKRKKNEYRAKCKMQDEFEREKE